MIPDDARPTILLVDDEPMSLDMLRGILRERYRIKVAINGTRALEIAGGEQPPALILLDVMMPGIDGFEVCRRLKANPATAAIPVIFVTGLNGIQDEEQAFEAGAVDYITKPFRPRTVQSRVNAHAALYQRTQRDGGLAASGVRSYSLPATASATTDSELVERLLDVLVEFARAADNQEIVHIAEELRTARRGGEDCSTWLTVLNTAAVTHRPAAAHAADGTASADRDDTMPDRHRIAELLAEISSSLEAGDVDSETELRSLVQLLAGTPFVRTAEKVLFSVRNQRLGEAKRGVAELAHKFAASKR